MAFIKCLKGVADMQIDSNCQKMLMVLANSFKSIVSSDGGEKVNVKDYSPILRVKNS